MSTLEEGEGNLAPVHYEALVNAIIKALATSPKATLRIQSTPESTSLRCDIDLIAEDVAKQFAKSNRFPFENKGGTQSASVYLPTTMERQAFSKQIESLAVALLTQLNAQLEAQPDKQTLAHVVERLLTPMESFSGQRIEGLSYPLKNSYPLEKRRLHLQPVKKATSDPWLKGHIVTIRVENITTFRQQISQGIDTWLEQEGCEQIDREAVSETLAMMAENPGSPLRKLQASVVREAFARIQREAKVCYLAYLYNGMKQWKKQNREDARNLLRVLIKRLRLIDAFIHQPKSDAYFQVSYQGMTFNYRSSSARADAFDPLPIIPEIEGSLGEMTDRLHGAKQFLAGMKMKLNGEVHAHGGGGRPVFLYNLALLNPDGSEYRQREKLAKSPQRFKEKVLRTALLYYFAFIKMGDLSFDPTEDFVKEILTPLQSGSEEQKVACLKQLYTRIRDCNSKLQMLRDTIVEFLNQPSIGPASWTKRLVLSLNKRILADEPDNMITHGIFFKADATENNARDVLKYVAVEDASATANSICKLPLEIHFEPLYYYEGDESAESFAMEYETDHIRVLPTFFAPRVKEHGKYSIVRTLNRVMFYYPEAVTDMKPESPKAFVYYFTYLLLAYTLLHLLTECVQVEERHRLFVPVLRFHIHGKKAEGQEQKFDIEEFIYALSKTLSHLLAEAVLSNSQGFLLDTISGADMNRLKAALYSLYSGLPRRFRFPATPVVNGAVASLSSPIAHHLDKLAVIVVSSRKCDVNLRVSDYSLSNEFGEFIGMERQPDDSVRVFTLSTFSVNQESKDMYRRPEAILEQVKTWYAAGYRHFLYIAQAPYSSTLHISEKDEDDELFFMNREIIQSIRSVGPDLKVYPLYCDQYYVVNQRRQQRKRQSVDSLYIDDIGELSRLVNDPSRRSLVFFNIFSGASVREQVYNGVMSYTTLINVYANDPTYDQYIWNDLLSSNQPGTLRAELLDLLALLHFARYEKPRDLGFKLNPYKRIIGDNSVGKLSIFAHMKEGVHFNMLAFLTEVRSVLRARL